MLPVRHDRQAFLLALEELLFYEGAQLKAALCLRHLCFAQIQGTRASTQPQWTWISDIAYRPGLLFALTCPTFESEEVAQAAMDCLRLIAQQADGASTYPSL